MMSYFGLREWQFENTNIDRLASEIKKQGGSNKFLHGANLEFDMQTIDWDEYFFHYLPGIKKYFFKEKPSDNATSLKHYTRYVSYCLYYIYICPHAILLPKISIKILGCDIYILF